MATSQHRCTVKFPVIVDLGLSVVVTSCILDYFNSLLLGIQVDIPFCPSVVLFAAKVEIITVFR